MLVDRSVGGKTVDGLWSVVGIRSISGKTVGGLAVVGLMANGLSVVGGFVICPVKIFNSHPDAMKCYRSYT